MKKLSYIFLTLITAVLFTAWRESMSENYNGPSELHFSNGLSASEVIVEGSGSKEVKVPFGLLKPVDGTHSVSLVVDTKNSTAVEGKDFQIVENPVELKSGAADGFFTVKILEKGATSAGKKVVFSLSSPTIGNAVFDQSYTLNMALFCPVSKFVGKFNYSGEFFDPFEVEIVEDTKSNTLIIKNFAVPGNSLKLTYDNTGKINFASQATGYVHKTYGMVTISPTKGKQSTFNSCTRELTLYGTYTVAAGSFGDFVEVFKGK